MRVLGGMVAMVLGLGACGSSPTANTQPIMIGGVMSPTGAIDQVQAANLAIDEINHAGGVLGRPLQLVNKDDHFDPAMGTQAINDLVAAGPPAVVLGSVMSQVTLAVAAVTVPNHVPQISAASTSPMLTTYADD